MNCGAPYGLCAIRVTRLDSDGNADDDFAVSRKPVTVGFNPNIDQGTDVTARDGCGCRTVSVKGNPVFNWFEFTFGKDVLEPAIEALMTGDTPITDPGNGNLVVGINGAGALGCEDDPIYVGFEMWAKHYVNTAPDGTYKLVHWVFPSTRWQWGDNTIEEGVSRTVLTGFSRSNSLWGSGPYGDGPPDGSDVVEWARWVTNDDLPEATACGTLDTGAIGS
jgi:hypothetical protein